MSKREEMREAIKQITNEEVKNLFRSEFIREWGSSWSKFVKTNPPDNPYPNGFKMEDVLSTAEEEYFLQWKENWEYMEELLEEFKKELEKEFNLS